ncbi:MAG: methionyl-tRNA formyltransferase [Gammaproteobacteria bacterium]
MRLGFAGTPDFSVPTLAALYRWCATCDSEVVGVWTQPDRPSGRGRKIRPGPVKALALEHGTHIFQPRTLRDPDAVAQMAAAQLDLLVVIAYGLILPEDVLATPKFGCVNVHASLLPRWRGAAPIHRAIAAGDTVTGIGIMAMDKGLDTGALWRNVPIDIAPDDTGGTLHDKLAAAGAAQLVDTLPDIFAGVAPIPQDDSMVTYAAKILKAEATLDFTRDAQALCDTVRAFVPWPVAQTTLDGAQLRIWSATAIDSCGGAPGEVMSVEEGLVVACGRGALRVSQVQVSGGRPTAAAEFARGNIEVGTILGAS